MQKKIQSLLSKSIVQHAIFWTIWYVLNSLRWGSYFGDYDYSFKSNAVEFPIHLIVVYFNLYYLLPRFIPEKYIKYIFGLLATVLFFSLLRIVITYELVTTEIWREAARDVDLFDKDYILAVFIGELYVVGITMAIKLTIDWVRSQKQTQDLIQKNHDTELALLRSQLQPHFFFNVLNNLYSLTLDKSDKAPETVLMLSDLMSYVIYKAKDQRVKLQDEIDYIQNYINLEILRYGDKLDVNFTIKGSSSNCSIPPLLFLPFIENSFKHGVSQKPKTVRIDIEIDITEENIVFCTKNTKYNERDNNLNKNNLGGIGIKNTKRRLNLLYGRNYNLEVVELKGEYKIALTLPKTL